MMKMLLSGHTASFDDVDDGEGGYWSPQPYNTFTLGELGEGGLRGKEDDGDVW